MVCRGDKIWRSNLIWPALDLIQNFYLEILDTVLGFLAKAEKWRRLFSPALNCCMRWTNLTLEIIKCYPWFGWRIGFKQFKKSCRNPRITIRDWKTEEVFACTESLLVATKFNIAKEVLIWQKKLDLYDLQNPDKIGHGKASLLITCSWHQKSNSPI